MFTTAIPVKPYVRKYLENCFGTPVLMRKDSAIGMYFYQLVDDPTERRNSEYGGFQDQVLITITEDVFLRKGCVLTDTNIIRFNNFVEEHLKMQLRIMIDTLIEFQEVKIKDAIMVVYDKFNMDETVLPYETLKKDYYRWSKRQDALPLLQINISGRSVPNNQVRK